MLDIWHLEYDECFIKNRTTEEIFKKWSKGLNNEVKKGALTTIYPIYEYAAVEKISRRLRKRIS